MPPGPDLPGDPCVDPADPNAEYYHLVLREILDAGVAVAQVIKETAAAHTVAAMRGHAEPGDAAIADLAAAYDRTARAVRRTIALARRVSAPPANRRQASASARQRIVRAVEDAIERLPRAAKPGDAPDDLRAELYERLDDPALDHDLLTRPVPEIIADICRDLGLAAQLAAPARERPAVADRPLSEPAKKAGQDTGQAGTGTQAPVLAPGRSRPPLRTTPLPDS